MIKEHLEKLKKYLFLMSLLFLLTTFIHISYNYIFYDSENIAIKWWVISEWIVWDLSHFNPLIPTTDDNKYIVNILYRSLLKYDLKEKKLVWDLANCDISNLSYIECFIENNIYWSNWEAITVKDIVSTYNILKTTDTNPIVKSLISETIIEEKKNSIVFKNSKKDVSFLNIFFQPILSKNVIDNLWVEDLTKPFYPTQDSIYSWKFFVSSVKEDKALWIIEVTLAKNEKYFNNDAYLDKIILKFFKSSTFLIRNKDIINVFNDDESVIWKSVPRLEPHYYTLPKYTTLFLNSERITSKSLRNFLLNKIDRNKLINVLWEEKYKWIDNPYLTNHTIDKEIENKNIDSIMNDNWYYKKSELTKLLVDKVELASQSGNTITTNNTPAELTIDEVEKKENTSLKYIISWLDKKFTFINEDDVLLKWDIKNESPDAIYIDSYKLKWFSAWDDYFYFRLKVESYETIKEWRNDYKIYFEKKWKKTLKEELTVFYYKDKDKLESAKTNFYSSFIKKQENIVTENKPEPKSSLNPELKAKLDSIDDKFYYNKKLEKFSLKLMYIWSEKDLINTSSFIQTTLWDYWIDIITDPINLNDLSKLISSWTSSNNYDMILAGINLGYFDFNIYPYFHSSQAKLWYNFANIKKLGLDIILEDINSNKLSWDKVKELQVKALDIIKEEQVIKTLYSPLINLLIDKNIKNFNMWDFLPSQASRSEYLSQIYVNQDKNINYQNKWIIDFFRFIYKIITW